MLYSQLKKLFPNIKKNVSLKEYTTFHIGGKSKYFLLVKTENQLVRAIKMAKKFSLPFFILGGGSNILISDEGYDGIVMKIQNSTLKVQTNSKIRKSKNRKQVIIECGGGALLSKLEAFALKNNLTGLEWAVGIPGTVGGAIRGNAGAFGKSMSNVVKSVRVFDSDNLTFQNYKRKDCAFSYRESIFKKYGNLIIISAIIRLRKGNKKRIKDKMKKYLIYRKEHQPLSFPSAGSIFKNYQGVIKDESLLNEFPQLLEFNKKKIIPAGFLIDKCELRKKTIGQAQISEKHANFVINLGKARSSDVIRLIDFIQDRVRDKFGINLEREIEIMG